MCDEGDLKKWRAQGKLSLNRRQLAGAGLVGAAGLGLAPGAAQACYDKEFMLTERAVSYRTADGTQDGILMHPPRSGKVTYPAVVFWPDIAGIRPANREMARRLAYSGYVVLVLNPYYRDVKGEQFLSFADFAANDGFARVKPWRAKFSPEAVQRDAAAAATWLSKQDAVDPSKRIGAQGYCMTGSFAMYAAKAEPQKFGAVASFHGGGLVGADGSGPISAMDGSSTAFLIAIAKNDDARRPEDTKALEERAKQAGAKAEIEVYPADHGWTVPDSPAFNRAEADRAWQRLLALYRMAL